MGNSLIRESTRSGSNPPVLKDNNLEGSGNTKALTNWNSFIDEVFKYKVGEDFDGNLIPINLKRSLCAVTTNDSGIINNTNSATIGNYFNISLPTVGLLVQEDIEDVDAIRKVTQYYSDGNIHNDIMKEEIIPMNVALIWKKPEYIVTPIDGEEFKGMRDFNAQNTDAPIITYIFNQMNKYNKQITKSGKYSNVSDDEINNYLPNRWHVLPDQDKKKNILNVIQSVSGGNKDSNCKTFVGTNCAKELWENGCLKYIENTDPDDIINYPNQFIYGPLPNSTYRFDTTNKKCIINSATVTKDSADSDKPQTRVPNYLGFKQDFNFNDTITEAVDKSDFKRNLKKYNRINPVYRVSEAYLKFIQTGKAPSEPFLPHSNWFRGTQTECGCVNARFGGSNLNTLPLKTNGNNTDIYGKKQKIYGANAKYAVDVENDKSDYNLTSVPNYLGSTNINPFSIDITGKWLVGDGLYKPRIESFVSSYLDQMKKDLALDIFCYNTKGDAERNSMQKFGYMGCINKLEQVVSNTTICTNIIQCIQCTAQTISFNNNSLSNTCGNQGVEPRKSTCWASYIFLFNLPAIDLKDVNPDFSDKNITSEMLRGKYILRLTTKDSLMDAGTLDSLSKGQDGNDYGMYQPPQIATWYKKDDSKYRILYMVYRGGGGLVIKGESKTDPKYGIPAYRVQYFYQPSETDQGEWVTLFGTKPNVIWKVPGSINNSDNKICIYDNNSDTNQVQFNKGEAGVDSMWWQYKKDENGQYYSDTPLSVSHPKKLTTDLPLYNMLFTTNHSTLSGKYVVMRINSSPFANFPPQDSVLTGNTLFIHSDSNNSLKLNTSLIYLGSNLPVTRAVYSAVSAADAASDPATAADDTSDPDAKSKVVGGGFSPKNVDDYKMQKYFQGNTAVAVWQAIIQTTSTGGDGENTQNHLIRQYILDTTVIFNNRGDNYPKNVISMSLNTENINLYQDTSGSYDKNIFAKLTIRGLGLKDDQIRVLNNAHGIYILSSDDSRIECFKFKINLASAKINITTDASNISNVEVIIKRSDYDNITESWYFQGHTGKADENGYTEISDAATVNDILKQDNYYVIYNIDSFKYELYRQNDSTVTGAFLTPIGNSNVTYEPANISNVTIANPTNNDSFQFGLTNNFVNSLIGFSIDDEFPFSGNYLKVGKEWTTNTSAPYQINPRQSIYAYYHHDMFESNGNLKESASGYVIIYDNGNYKIIKVTLSGTNVTTTEQSILRNINSDVLTSDKDVLMSNHVDLNYFILGSDKYNDYKEGLKWVNPTDNNVMNITIKELIHYKVNYNFKVYVESIKAKVTDCGSIVESDKNTYMNNLSDTLNLTFPDQIINNPDTNNTRFYGGCDTDGFFDLSIVYDLIFTNTTISDLKDKIDNEIHTLKIDSEFNFYFQSYEIVNQNNNTQDADTTQISTLTQDETDKQIMKLTITKNVTSYTITEEDIKKIAEIYGGSDVLYHSFETETETFTNVNKFSYEGFSNSNYYNLKENFTQTIKTVVIIKTSKFEPLDIINTTLLELPNFTVIIADEYKDLIIDIERPQVAVSEKNEYTINKSVSNTISDTTTKFNTIFPIDIKIEISNLKELIDFLNVEERNKLLEMNDGNVNKITADNLIELDSVTSMLNGKPLTDFEIIQDDDSKYYIKAEFDKDNIYNNNTIKTNTKYELKYKYKFNYTSNDGNDYNNIIKNTDDFIIYITFKEEITQPAIVFGSQSSEIAPNDGSDTQTTPSGRNNKGGIFTSGPEGNSNSILGGTLGGIVGLLLIGGLVYYFVNKKKGQNTSTTHDNDLPEDIDSYQMEGLAEDIDSYQMEGLAEDIDSY